MRAIDIDSHFWEPLDWLADVDPGLKAEIESLSPPVWSSFAEIFLGLRMTSQLSQSVKRGVDALLPMPEFRVGDASIDLIARTTKSAQSSSKYALSMPGFGACNPAERIEFCNAQGIDIQVVNPTLGSFEDARLQFHCPQLSRRYRAAYNSWATETLAGYTARLIPTTLIDFGDPSAAVAELTRVRKRGSRTFIPPLHPVDGRSIAHVDFDRIWAASVDLGMIPVLHDAAWRSFGFESGWCNVGNEFEGRTAMMIGLMEAPQVATTLLSSMLASGLFDRHPRLVVVVQENLLSWVPNWYERLGMEDFLGEMPAEWMRGLRPRDYVGRNIRFSPLTADAEHLHEVIASCGPRSVCFATDYPHPEGPTSAIEYFSKALEGRVDAEARELFFGGNAAELLARGA